jgi:hypothetical protein
MSKCENKLSKHVHKACIISSNFLDTIKSSSSTECLEAYSTIKQEIYRYEIVDCFMIARFSYEVLNGGNDRNCCEENEPNVDFGTFAAIISKI